ncbi:GNAT family N-acetyltransferase [bacterium]|nr:GNAT family N-acetyltransferase [bacterium]
MSDPSLSLGASRLVLRLAAPADVPAILAFFEENRAHLSPYEPARSADFYTPARWVDQVRRNQEEFEAGQSLRLFVFLRDRPSQVIGSVNFTAIQRGVAQMCNLGYALAAEAQGHGYMAEALEVAIAYVFETLNLHRIQANYMPRNQRSGNLLKRLGFVTEGVARDYLQINGRWEDHILTSLTHPHWRPIP